jgi:hypothetical protein
MIFTGVTTMARYIELNIDQGIDELGDPEVFVGNLSVTIRDEETKHLEDNGLPSIGTYVRPNMILVGKYGNSKHMADGEPPGLEFDILTSKPFEYIKEKYGYLYIDSPLYVPAEIYGTVVKASLEPTGKFVNNEPLLTARVVIEIDEAQSS